MVVIRKTDYSPQKFKAVVKKHLNADWQCPRCETVNPVWEDVQEYQADDYIFVINYRCYECNYKRPTGKAHNLNGRKPRVKRIKAYPTEKTDLVYRERGKARGKWYTIEYYQNAKTVRLYWGVEVSDDNSGSFKEINFDSRKDALNFYNKKVAEKLKNGYRDHWEVKKEERRAKRQPKVKDSFFALATPGVQMIR